MESIEGNAHQLLKPRMKVVKGFPNSAFSIGEIICEPSAQQAAWANEFPHIFYWMNWWQDRTIEELKAVRYVKVITYVGYYLVGDIVPVNQFEGGSVPRAKPTGYYLSDNENHLHPVFDVIPSTKEEYEIYIANNK